MADYYLLISRALADLPKNTAADRRALYDRARGALVVALQPYSVERRMVEQADLEEAIARVERKVQQEHRSDAPKLSQSHLALRSQPESAQSEDVQSNEQTNAKSRRRVPVLLIFGGLVGLAGLVGLVGLAGGLVGWGEPFTTIAQGIGVFFAGLLGLVGALAMGTPTPPPYTGPVVIQQMNQVNRAHLISRSTDPPKAPTSSDMTDPAILNERREESDEEAQAELKDALDTLRGLRAKLFGNSALLDRLDRVIRLISENVDELKEAFEVLDLIHTMYELAEELRKIKEREKEREEDLRKKEKNIRRLLTELESDAQRIFHTAGIR